jgi:thioredoxin-related protein
MRKLFFVLFTLLWISTNAQEIKWMSLEQAVKAQKTTPKKIIIDAYTTWCGPCKMLDKNTFGNKDVANYINENFYPVKFNAEGNEVINFQGKTFTNPNFNPNSSGRNSSHDLAAAFGVKAYPTIIYLDEQANLITPIPGYKSPKQLELYLKLFNNNDYKNINSQEEFNEYYSNFSPKFIE